MAGEQHYTINEAADLLRVSRWSIYRYIDTGGLVAVKAQGKNGAVRIPASSLNDWIKRHTVTVISKEQQR